MIKIDSELLRSVGLGQLDAASSRLLLQHLYETLELRVGQNLANRMTADQLDQSERYFDAQDDEGAFAWLQKNFPSYKEIVDAEFEQVRAELSANAPAILAHECSRLGAMA